MDLSTYSNRRIIFSLAVMLNVFLRFCVHTANDTNLFQVLPRNTTTCVGDFATFTCSTISDGRFFWFVDDKPVTKLPPEYQASSISERGKHSTLLRMLGHEETNNSKIICAVDPAREISIFSDPVFLIVVESPPPPMDLTISTNVLTLILNVTWKSENKLREAYVVHVIDNSTSTQTAQIEKVYTTETHVLYDLRKLYGIDCYSLASVVFSVSAVHSWSGEVSCTSEESETKRIPDVSFIIQGCKYPDAYNGREYQLHDCSLMRVVFIAIFFPSVWTLLLRNSKLKVSVWKENT